MGPILRVESSRLDESPGASRGPRLAGSSPLIRVVAFIDGFNLYHAVDELKKPHLKWLDLKQVILSFVDPTRQRLVSVYYFSAYATWLPDAHARHQAFVKAIESTGVKAIMGNFKQKTRGCNGCGAGWIAHEEKESDVNLALAMARGAYRNEYDEAFLVTGDSDIAPSVRMVKEDFPAKKIKLITPPGRRDSKELFAITDKQARIKDIHLERSLFPQDIVDEKGNLIVRRPAKYDPPSGTP